MKDDPASDICIKKCTIEKRKPREKEQRCNDPKQRSEQNNQPKLGEAHEI